MIKYINLILLVISGLFLLLPVFLILFMIFSCTPQLKYKDEICYDKCLSEGLYVKEDTESSCVCIKLKDN